MSELTHIRENNEDTQRHLDENRDALELHCQFLLGMMQRGKRLTIQMVRDMHIDDRRLRNLRETGKCKSEWMYKTLPNGKVKRTHVEYFCEIPKLPTKKEVAEGWHKQIELFE